MKYLLKLIFILFMFFTPLFAQAQLSEKTREHRPLNNFDELDFEINPNFPESDSFLTPNICGTLGAKVVENYNAHVRFFRKYSASTASGSLIGEKGARVWQISCYDNQKHLGQFVVTMSIARQEKIKKDPLNKKRHAFPRVTTVFDEDLGIIGWTISGIEVS